MAVTRKLSLRLLNRLGGGIVFSYAHAKKAPSSSDVKALMQGLIANYEIFDRDMDYLREAVSIGDAKLIETDTKDIELFED